MSVTFSHFWALPAMIAGVISLAAAAIALWMTRRRSRAWRAARLWIPGFAALAVSLALASPAIVYSGRASNVVILLDLSGSTRASPWRDPGWVRRLAERRLDPRATVSVAGFAGDVQLLLDHVGVEDAARWPTAWPRMEPDNRSDVTAAFAWRSVAEARGEEALSPRWLITDGLAATPSSGGEKFPLALTEIAPPAADPDVGVTDLLRLADGELNIQLRATGPATAVVDVRRDQHFVAHQAVRFTAPEGSSRWLTIDDSSSIGAADVHVGPHRYDVSIRRTPTPDPWPENDRASLWWAPAAPPRLLVVGNPLPPALPGMAPFQSATIAPSAFPSDPAALVAGDWQVIVLDDVPFVSETPAETLSAPQRAALNQFVRVTGGGLLIRGTSHAFGPGHNDDSENILTALSPVFSSPPDRPRAHIVFLIDASGSMNESAGAGGGGGGGAAADQKFRLAARGVLGALDQLHARDQVTVLAFNSVTERLAAGTKEALAPALAALLARVQPTGATAPDTALPEIARAFAGKPRDEPGMVILLTDGEIPSMDVARWRSVVEGGGGATLTVVAPPPAAASAPNSLAALAGAIHAQWLPTRDATQWPRLLRRALADRFAGREHDAAVVWHSMNLDPALEGTAARWVEVWRKPEALNLAAGGGFTLAAIAQRGLGKVAAVAMENESSALVGPILQRLAPPAGDRRFALAARREKDSWMLTADASDDGIFLNGIALRARLLESESTSIPDIAFRQTGPGRYEARVDSPHPLAAIVVEGGGSGGREHFIGRLQIPRVELAEWPASVEAGDRFGMLAEVRILPGDGAAERRWLPVVAGWRIALARPLWLIAMVLLIASLMISRVR